MRKFKKYTYYIYLVGTIGTFLAIIAYILLVRSTYDTASHTRLTIMDTGIEASDLVKAELTHYFSIKNEAEWQQRVNNSKMETNLRKELYGNYYNTLFFDKKPTYRVLETYISIDKPYIVTLEVQVTNTEGTGYYTIQAVVDDNTIIDIKVF